MYRRAIDLAAIGLVTRAGASIVILGGNWEQLLPIDDGPSAGAFYSNRIGYSVRASSRLDYSPLP